MDPKREPTQTCHVTRPFLRILSGHSKIHASVLQVLGETDPAKRVEVAKLQTMLGAAVAITGDPDLGLRAAKACEVGDFELIEYVCTSASTGRGALETLLRYSQAFDESAHPRLEVDGGRASLILHSSVPLVRAGTDFQVAAYFVLIGRWLQPVKPEFEAHFRHAAPGNLEQYAATFGDARLHFGASFDGLTCDAAHLDLPMRTAEANLHSLLRARAEELLAEVAALNDPWLGRVRADILKGLPHGDASVERTAKHLGMSRRTLARRLSLEGTTFTEQMQDVRIRSADHYLRESAHSVEEISFLLGYSESPAFVRAFKRWKGTTPFEYRRAKRAE